MTEPALPASRGIGRFFQGALAFVVSAFLFSQATVFSKILGSEPYGINSVQVVFFRFAIGILVMSLVVWRKKESLRPERPSLIIARGVFNSVAVMLLFAAASHTTIANANILNLTYPAWVFLTAPLINKEKANGKSLVFFFLTMAGAFLVAGGSGGPWTLFSQGINAGDLMALVSGFLASFGISFLREARKHDSTTMVLWYLFLIGTLVLLVPTILVWKTPGDLLAWTMIVAAAACGILGQFLLTYGYKYVSANEGSLLSASGVLTSALLGFLWFGEHIHPWLVAGGLLVLISIAGLSLGMHHKKN